MAWQAWSRCLPHHGSPGLAFICTVCKLQQSRPHSPPAPGPAQPRPSSAKHSLSRLVPRPEPRLSSHFSPHFPPALCRRHPRTDHAKQVTWQRPERTPHLDLPPPRPGGCRCPQALFSPLFDVLTKGLGVEGVLAAKGKGRRPVIVCSEVFLLIVSCIHSCFPLN